MRILMLIGLLLATTATLNAQTDTVFVDEYDIKCSRSRATAYFLYSPANDGLYKEEHFDIATHKLKAVYHKVHPDSFAHEGKFTEFYGNGAKEFEGQYKQHRRSGEWKYYDEESKLAYTELYEKNEPMLLTAYYPNGKVKCVEHHDPNKKTYGERFDENGYKVAYTPYLVQPVANFNVHKFLFKNFTYPAEAKEYNIEGETRVKFTITPEGKITNIKIAKHLCPSLDAEAIRVVSKMTSWQPGMKDGKPTSFVYYLPISVWLE